MAEAIDIRELNERIERQSAFVTNLMTGMDQVIVGQKHLVESLLIGLLSDGHILLEGVPGLAKTLAIKTLASLIDAKYSRIQFTPDLLPADVIGTMIYSQKDEQFIAKKGPIFANFVLADEINRAPAKVQSALLEAMQERQVTLSKETFMLPEPFLVMATQNPIEQEGTYPLPEAQVDRFMLKVIIDYPKLEEEKKIIRQNITGEKIEVRPPTISCSTSCTSPPSKPSLTIALISSSVTLFSSFALIPVIFITREVLFDNNQTKGKASFDKKYIGLATNIETRSAYPIPIRFGTSSPIIKVR